MGKNVILTSEGAMQFSNALDLLNTSIKEFNLVIDKLIPEKLIKETLSVYLSELCDSLKHESKMNISFNSDGNITANTEIKTAIYRIFKIVVMVLIRFNPLMEIRISLAKNNESLKLLINDNGTQNIMTSPDQFVNEEIEKVKSILEGVKGNLHHKLNLTTGNVFEIDVPY